ncbi:MAG: cysteine synthase A [Bacteriovoracaceae bacterium]|nr:cysteine synthase A [Bacteriovoracaceae bacterium]
MSILEAIGNTPLIEIPSLSKLTGSKIFLKCENLNPGGSIKDRAAKLMILNAIADGRLQKGMTIIEGTAGNTGIGLAIVGNSLGFEVKIVMPNNQTKEKERLIEFYGAELILVAPCPFADQNHFYHTARRLSEENPRKYFWVNQFENLDNHLAHYQHTGPEIWEQTNGKIDYLVSTAGSGGTIGGCSKFLKEQKPALKVVLVDPEGSGLAHFYKHGEFKSSGSSITEGIGIMRLVANFKKAIIDDAFTLPDQELVNIAYYVKKHDNIVLGPSAALNVAAAFKIAKSTEPGQTIVTFWCDSGERSSSKLYSLDFLKSKNLSVDTDFIRL